MLFSTDAWQGISPPQHFRIAASAEADPAQNIQRLFITINKSLHALFFS
jgi:hypothetical protein